MKPSEVLAHIQQISCLGLPSEVAIPAMLDSLEMLVPASNVSFVWTDAGGRIQNLYVREPVFSAIDFLLHSSSQLEPDFSFQKQATSELSTGFIARFRGSTDYFSTVAYNEIFKPCGMTEVYDLILKDHQGSRGVGMIGRLSPTPFTAEERNRIEALRPWLLHALDAPPVEALNSAETGEEAILLCDQQGRIVEMGPNARKLLLYAGNGQIAPGARIASLGDAMPESVRRVCHNLAAVQAGRATGVPSARLNTPWGAFNFRAHLMGGGSSGVAAGDLLAVVIRRERPLPLQLHDRVGTLPLTPRQRQVAVRIGLGRSPESIQRDLELSAGTYRRHAEEIHGRLDVHSRAELMACLLAVSPI